MADFPSAPKTNLVVLAIAVGLITLTPSQITFSPALAAALTPG